MKLRRRARQKLDRLRESFDVTECGWGDGDEWDKTYAYFDRAWASVMANLKKRFETGPVDWTEWMNALRKMQQSPKK